MAHAICQVPQPPHARGGDGTFRILSITRGAADVKPFNGAVPRERAERLEIHATTRDDRQARAGALDKLTKASASHRKRLFPTARQDCINP